MYSMVNTVNNMVIVYLKFANTVDLKYSHHTKAL